MVQTATPCNVVSWPKAVFTLSSVTRKPLYSLHRKFNLAPFCSPEQPDFKKNN